MQVDPDWWKFLFDDLYLVTDARSVCDDDLTCREVDLFCKMISMTPADRILDLCGGHGRHSIELSRRGFVHCTVFDYSDALLKIGGKNAEYRRLPIQFVKGDARQLPFEPSTYHHVLILGNSLGYIPEQDADQGIIRESYRILRPGGRLLIVDFAPHDLEFLREEYAHDRLGFAPTQVVQWFKDAGLEPLEQRDFEPQTKGGREKLTVSLWLAARPDNVSGQPIRKRTPVPAVQEAS